MIISPNKTSSAEGEANTGFHLFIDNQQRPCHLSQYVGHAEREISNLHLSDYLKWNFKSGDSVGGLESVKSHHPCPNCKIGKWLLPLPAPVLLRATVFRFSFDAAFSLK
jgi:hypothetical protein